MLELVREHDSEETRIEADAEERRRRGVTFRELAGEWMDYLEHEKGAKPSTLRDYRWLLAEPGQPHRRGTGRSPGLLMATFGDCAAQRDHDARTSPTTSAASTATERRRAR